METWELEDSDGQTRLTFVQSGFDEHHPPYAGWTTLARREAWRIVRHPIVGILLGYFVVLVATGATGGVWPPSRASVREVLLTLGLLWFGPAAFFASNLVASSARRAHAESQLAAAPTTAQARTVAVCVGVLLPTALAAGFAAVLWIVEHVGGALPHAQSLAELAVMPICTLGGGLLGVAAAEWLPWRGTALIVLFGLIAWVVAVMDQGDPQWTGPWTMSPAYYDEIRLTAGSHAWHAAYLLGLALLAGVAALLRHPPHRRLLFAIGAMLWIATLAACWAQMS